MTDPITDMLNRIRNAQAVNHATVDIPFSNLKYKMAKILERERYVEKIDKKKKKPNPKIVRSKIYITITLRYANGAPIINGLKRISKSGQRIYTPWKKIKKTKGGQGISIISTSKGLMTGKEARKNKLGGEVICEIW